MVERDKFRVVEGAWIAAPALVDLPQAIRARAPNDRNRPCRVRVNREDVAKAAAQRRRQPIYDFWAILNGKVPPVPHRIDDAEAGLCTLFDASACFRGMRRPIGEDADGHTFLAYILKPTFFFAYDPRPPLSMMHKRSVDHDLVFVAYVRLDQPVGGGATIGVLTHWQFVEADPRDNNLPLAYDERYLERLW